MSREITRRDFLKAGAVGLAATSMLGSVKVFADEKEDKKAEIPFAGKKKFAGIGSCRNVTEDVVYVGVSDRRIQLFENVYPVPRGVSYNSYVLLDDKNVLFDTVDRSVTGQFFENLTAVLDGQKLDYLVVNHMEPDHSSAISEVLVRYPEAKVVCTKAASVILNQFFACDISDRSVIVGEGDTLNVGKHTLTFVMAPMVHWPEVMMTYDSVSGILFSADAFGSFGALNGNLFADEVNFEKDWLPDARRYYCNIVGKYGQQVQSVLAKAGGVDIRILCPTHGPVWRKNLGWILNKYNLWSSYTPEDKAVMVVYGSVYGGTESAANAVAAKISQAGVADVAVYDVSKTHVSELIAEAFRCSHIVLASITYNMGIFTPMKNFLLDLEAHNLQNRCFSFVENGSWSPVSGKQMREIVDRLGGCSVVGKTVTIKSSPATGDNAALTELAEAVSASVLGSSTSQKKVEAAVSKKWVCTVCGYVYEGDKLPEDYKCPLCGAGISAFKEA
ncbi:MAG: MBL fold metallo-hydrolase [Synergistaceae bacterium]|nr:MBL fold metallo-hydrolase [Synergistaceae bacterium]MBQ6666099.1 MBL fold metallo-hydrolase [Synergistaceae bacterium]